MVRISNIDLPRNKRIDIGLTYIFGIGKANSLKILNLAQIPFFRRCSDLSDEEVSTLRTVIDTHYPQTEGTLKRYCSLDLKRLLGTGCLIGRRHRLNLPVRGQRTRTNARTRKGKSKIPSGKKL